MSKWHGKIGYAYTVETTPGVNKSMITVKPATGDIIEHIRRYSNGDNLAGEITSITEISVLLTPYSIEHYAYIKYVEYAGVKWSVEKARLQYPRIILTLGGVYNAESS